jgi:hypothetical protein
MEHGYPWVTQIGMLVIHKPGITVLIFVLMLVILLIGCIPPTPVPPMSVQPLVGSTGTAGSLATFELIITPTLTSTPTVTPTYNPIPSPTPVPSPMPTPAPKVNVLIPSCDTGIDFFNQLGEVTNAYVTVQNVGVGEVTNLKVVLQANDEERVHADKSYTIQDLPPGYEISLKLTVDTGNNVDTTIMVFLNSVEGVNVSARKPSCQQRRLDQDIINKMGELFVVKRISSDQ